MARVFLAWSGPYSERIAAALRIWLDIIQGLDVFMSSVDVQAGTVWDEKLAEELSKADFGIICLTPDNLSSEWIHFEAGALALGLLKKSRVTALLCGVSLYQVSEPIRRFQNTALEPEPVLRLLRSINALGSRPRADENLTRDFNSRWPDLKNAIDAELADLPAANAAPPRDSLEQTVDRLSIAIEEVRGMVLAVLSGVAAPRPPRRAGPRRYRQARIRKASRRTGNAANQIDLQF